MFRTIVGVLRTILGTIRERWVVGRDDVGVSVRKEVPQWQL